MGGHARRIHRQVVVKSEVWDLNVRALFALIVICQVGDFYGS